MWRVGVCICLTLQLTLSRYPTKLQSSAKDTYLSDIMEVGDNLIPRTIEEQVSQFNTLLLTHISVMDSNVGPLHLTLDNGTTCSYIEIHRAIDRGYNINPNMQSSQSGDGKIDIPLYRNYYQLHFHAIVTKNLHFLAIGGTTFICCNVKQDFQHNQLSLLGYLWNLPTSQREAFLPISKSACNIHNNTLSPAYPIPIPHFYNTVNTTPYYNTVHHTLPDKQILVKANNPL